MTEEELKKEMEGHLYLNRHVIFNKSESIILKDSYWAIKNGDLYTVDKKELNPSKVFPLKQIKDECIDLGLYDENNLPEESLFIKFTFDELIEYDKIRITK